MNRDGKLFGRLVMALEIRGDYCVTVFSKVFICSICGLAPMVSNSVRERSEPQASKGSVINGAFRLIQDVMD